MISDGVVLKNVSFSFDSRTKILKNINLRIDKGSFVGVAGGNGSGKTTFTKLLNGLIPQETEGELTGGVFIDGDSTRDFQISHFAKKVGMVFQNPDFSLFNLTVAEEVEFVLKNLNIKNSAEKIADSLKLVGMEKLLRADPQSLSFGQKQKVALASVLVQQPRVLVLDEPTAMLDYKSGLNLFSILKKLNKKGTTVVTVEHDTDLLEQYASRIIILDKGKVAADGSPKATAVGANKLRGFLK